jgi:hypothetical protein
MSNELVVIENLKLDLFFTKGESVDSVLEQIEKEAMSFVVGDLSVKKNRDAVKAMVTKVTKSKTYLESRGKELAAEYKEIPKRIDINRKKTKDFLTDLQARVRQPLTEWEEEDKRIKAEEAAAIEAENLRIQMESDHEIAMLMDEKFERELAEKISEEKRMEEDRQAQLEKERIEREARIAEEAKLKAEQEAKQREENLERERLAAIEREEQAKRNAIAAEERAKAQSEEAERQRLIAEEKAKRDAEEAAERARQLEIDRQKREEERLKAEADKKAADREHAGLIHSQMVDAFVANGIDKETAIIAVTAIAKGLIPSVKINY